MQTHRSIGEQVEALAQYSACDVSNALLKLQKPVTGRAAKGGYLADIVPYAPSSPFAPTFQPKIIGPATTLKLIDISEAVQSLEDETGHSIPKGTHWADIDDITVPGSVLVIEQPLHQTCAAVGGIMATRMSVKGVSGCVVSGRVRDIGELKKSGLPIWALGQSTVGSGAESKAHSRNITINVKGVPISPGDIIFAESVDGIVVISHKLVDNIIDLIPRLVRADERVKADIQAGSLVSVAFNKHRS